ncbi:MAG TPA: hypothetical protein VLL52_20830 [Anaerolineae bacterium]|nr:hypothetical protein [Anaerolineae bacterium]
MKEGMLWLDADKGRQLTEKIERAVDYYENKYGHLPELCMVNGNSIEQAMAVGKVQVEPAKNILPHHFWLGMRERENATRH